MSLQYTLLRIHKDIILCYFYIFLIYFNEKDWHWPLGNKMFYLENYYEYSVSVEKTFRKFGGDTNQVLKYKKYWESDKITELIS